MRLAGLPQYTLRLFPVWEWSSRETLGDFGSDLSRTFALFFLFRRLTNCSGMNIWGTFSLHYGHQLSSCGKLDFLLPIHESMRKILVHLIETGWSVSEQPESSSGNDFPKWLVKAAAIEIKPVDPATAFQDGFQAFLEMTCASSSPHRSNTCLLSLDSSELLSATLAGAIVLWTKV